jgi:hypothetical protein
VLLRLLRFRQLEPGGFGLVCGAYPAVKVRVGNSWSGLVGLGWEVTVKVYGVSRDDAAGVEPGASLVDRTPVNVGTARGRSLRRLRPGGQGWG